MMVIASNNITYYCTKEAIIIKFGFFIVFLLVIWSTAHEKHAENVAPIKARLSRGQPPFLVCAPRASRAKTLCHCATTSFSSFHDGPHPLNYSTYCMSPKNCLKASSDVLHHISLDGHARTIDYAYCTSSRLRCWQCAVTRKCNRKTWLHH